MRKSNFKALFIIAITMLITFNPGYASTIKDYFLTGGTGDLNSFSNLLNNLITTLKWIGYFLAICVTLITGIQFLTASPQKKAMLKEKLWLIVLGVILLAAGIPLLQIIANAIQNMANMLFTA